jgi:transcriptional regulator with XRE-family HTH domain
MDLVRLGRTLRALRIRRGWRQADLAMRAGLSRSLISSIERGAAGGMALATLRRVFDVLGADVDIRVRWHGEALDRLLDEVHAAVVNVVVQMLRASGWEVAVEASFSIWGERGRIDVLAFHPVALALVVCEIKSAISDSQDTVGDLDRKTRLAPTVAAERGWQAASVSRVLVIAASRTARRRVETLAATFGSAFPVRGTAVKRWLRNPNRAISGLLFVSSDNVDGVRRTIGGRQRVRRPKSGPMPAGMAHDTNRQARLA